MLRQALHPDYFRIQFKSTPLRTDHCIKSIRESIMCSVDVTPDVWSWDDGRQRSILRSDSVHTCRNFEAIRGWVAKNHLVGNFDSGAHVTDELDK